VARDEDDLAAFADDTEDAVAVHLAQIVDVGRAGLEDAQPEEAEHGHQGEVVRVGRLPRGGQQGLELQMRQAEGG
jgi:hypothetical protein